MRIAGIILVVIGVIGLAFGGITYTRRKDTVSVGPISATVRQRETFPIGTNLSIVSLVAGVALIVAGSRKRA